MSSAASTARLPLSLSARVHDLHPSPIREILEVVGRPGMISFAGGLPAAETFPDFGLSAPDSALQYGPTEGDPALRARIAEELAAAAFKDTAPGAISQPVKSDFGWHVVRVVKVTKPGTSQKFEDLRAEIAKRVKAEKGADALYEVINRIDDALAGHEMTLEQLAQEYKLKPIAIEAVDASGFTAAGRKADLDALPKAEKVIEAAFALKEEGAVSSLIEADDGSFVVVSVSKLTPAEAKPFAEVRREDIDRADAGMSAWMGEYKDPEGKPADEAILYLQDQKQKIEKNRDDIRAALNEGKKLLPQQ